MNMTELLINTYSAVIQDNFRMTSYNTPWEDTVYILDTQFAQVNKKECFGFSLQFEREKDNSQSMIWNLGLMMLNTPAQLFTKFSEITTAKINSGQLTGYNNTIFDSDRLKVYLRKTESKRVWPNDLSIIKPLLKSPKKWTKPAIVRALVNGQVTARCTGSYTDDYAYDYAYDYGRGESDCKALARKIIEHPGGYHCHLYNGELSLSFASCQYWNLTIIDNKLTK